MKFKILVIFFFLILFLSHTLSNAQEYHTANVGVLISNTNANQQTAYGTYDFQTGNGTGNSNYPVLNNEYGNLINFKSQYFGTQLLAKYGSDPELFYRANYGSNFTSWTKVVLERDGNVGFGTTSPQATIDISKTHDATATKALKLFYNGSWFTPTYATDYRFLDISSSEGGKILQVNGYGMGIGFDPPIWASSDKLYVNGNVGIGTTSPAEKLSVNGKIRAKEIKVENANWPDYVFKENYKLKPLSQVESFIKKHNHLEDVPSAATVEKEGVELGANQAILLKKIEELTLHLIEMDKKLEKQNEKIIQQEKTNDEHAAKIKKLESLNQDSQD